ncbi:MAG: rRNA maturation RNase YbeY [Traorella sp.]
MITYINQTENENWNQYENRFQEIFKKTREILKIEKDYEVSIILVNAKEIHEINYSYRNVDKATDVISFALKDSEDEMFIDELDLELGDIFINVEAVVEQAKEYGHSECREISFLCTHGLLHLLGYDHMEKDDEEVMFHLQDVILDGFNF